MSTVEDQAVERSAVERQGYYDFLKKVPLFADLPDEDLKSLCPKVREVQLAKGEELFAEGAHGDEAFVIMEGQLEIVMQSSGREVLLAVRRPGEVIGEMALLVESPRMASARARTDGVMLAIHKEQLDHLMTTSLPATRAMFCTLLDRWRDTEDMLRQSEKMAQLGTLTAGVAHELNNPAAAVRSSSDQLQASMTQLTDAQGRLGRLTLNEAQHETLQSLAREAEQVAVRPPEMDALTRSDREYELETLLEERDVPDPWEIAPALVNLGYDADKLDDLAQSFASEELVDVIGSLNATYVVHNLVSEIGQGAGRLSDIVKALKGYSYLDQAPVQSVDVHEGLDNTLLILRSKIADGISVRKEYASDMPKIEAYGSELNQVWTNLIDNAADALDGGGVITIRTRPEGKQVVVEIEDNGPGIPPEIQSKIFDSFFTTKPPGQGTGLGLDISYKIVVERHRGDVKLDSEPGRTTFQVWLPVDFEAA